MTAPEHIDIGSLDAGLLSHCHADHVADLSCLQYAIKAQMDLGLRSDPLPQ